MDEEKQDGSDFDDILLEESSGGDGGSADLELDAFQATEIRTIFLTTLPDYLDPVRQMLEQLLSADNAAEMRQALDTTLESIQTAASRVQIDDVSEVVRQMRAQLSEQGPISEEKRESLWAGLSRIEQIAAEVATGDARPHSETIVSALARAGGIDEGVLEKLTAAGLVTVDQIRMADPKEIMAVSGLPAAIVERLIAAVAEKAPAPVDPPPQASPSPPPPHRQGQPEGAPAAPEERLETLLRQQVESELDIEQRRAQLLRLRTNLHDLREQLTSTEGERLTLEKRVTQANTKFADQLHTLSQIEIHRARLQQRHATLCRELDAIASRISHLEQLRLGVQEERNRFSERLLGATERVGKLVDSFHEESWDPIPEHSARKS